MTIQRDPRATDITDADLEQQFKLSMQIRDSTDRANKTVVQIRAVDQQIQKRGSQANDASIAAEASAIKAKLDELEQRLYQVKNRSPRDTLNYPIKLNNQLAVLQELVDEGKHRPTDQDYVVFRQLSATLETIVDHVDHVFRTDLRAFNQRLAKVHLEPVSVPTR